MLSSEIVFFFMVIYKSWNVTDWKFQNLLILLVVKVFWLRPRIAAVLFYVVINKSIQSKQAAWITQTYKKTLFSKFKTFNDIFMIFFLFKFFIFPLILLQTFMFRWEFKVDSFYDSFSWILYFDELRFQSQIYVGQRIYLLAIPVQTLICINNSANCSM
jgi:hypothetical protein